MIRGMSGRETLTNPFTYREHETTHLPYPSLLFPPGPPSVAIAGKIEFRSPRRAEARGKGGEKISNPTHTKFLIKSEPFKMVRNRSYSMITHPRISIYIFFAKTQEENSVWEDHQPKLSLFSIFVFSFLLLLLSI